MSTPTLFISHKHSDNKIAKLLGDFLEEKSNNRVKIHLSSSPDLAQSSDLSLNAQLRQALWGTDVLILIYTSADQDWSYCMWECGVASDSHSPETTLVVFQCGPDVPAPFQDVLRVNPRNCEDLKRFMEQFLRAPNFFSKLNGEAIAPGLKEAYLDNMAAALHQQMALVLPPPDDGLSKAWPTWPFLRIELPRSEVDRLEQADESERVALSHQIVKDSGVIIESDARAAQLFGVNSFPNRMKLSVLLKNWKDKNPTAEGAWFDSCAEQIMMGAARGFPVIRWTSIREPGGDSDYTPVLSRIKPLAFGGTVQFDLYFYNLSDPKAVPITSKMIPIKDFFHKKIGQIDPQTLKLTELITELKTRQLNRLPILSAAGHPLYIVHRSMIEQFMVNYVMAGGTATGDLTLADLLADPEMKEIFENTFVAVKKQGTLAEAMAAMLTKQNCNDVCVTAGGNLNEPVLGWLTNVDIARNS